MFTLSVQSLRFSAARDENPTGPIIAMTDHPDDTPRRRGRPRTAAPAESGIRTLDRSLDILAALAAGGGLSLTDLAARLHQPTSTVHRMLMTLERRGMAEIDPATQQWHVGAETFRIGSAFMRRSGIVERARPILEALMRATGETTNLGVIRNGKVLFVAQVETHEMIRAFFPLGTESPMHASGIGKALLAHRSPEEVAAFAAGGLERFTDRTLTDPAALAASLAEIRERGFALDDEERTEGMRCIAVAARDRTGSPVAGVSISGPVHRVRLDRVEEIGQHVAEAARALSRALGYRPPEDDG